MSAATGFPIPIHGLPNGQVKNLHIHVARSENPVVLPDLGPDQRPEVVWHFAPYTVDLFEGTLKDVEARWEQDGRIHLRCRTLFDEMQERFRAWSRTKVIVSEHIKPVLGSSFLARKNQEKYFEAVRTPPADFMPEQKKMLIINLLEILNRAKFSFSRLIFRDLDLEGIDLKEAILDYAQFLNCSLRNAKLRGASLVGANFKTTDLSDIDITPGTLLDLSEFQEQMTCSRDHSIVAIGHTDVKYYKFDKLGRIGRTDIQYTYREQGLTVTALKFLNNSQEQILFIGLSNGRIGVENLLTDQSLYLPTGFTAPVKKLHSSHCSQYFFAADANGNRAIFEFKGYQNLLQASFQPVYRFPQENPCLGGPFCFLPHSAVLACAESRRLCKDIQEVSFLTVESPNSHKVVWKTTNGLVLSQGGWSLSCEQDDKIIFLEYSSHGELVLAGTANGLFVWSLKDPARTLYYPIFEKRNILIKCAYFSKDANSLFYLNHFAKCMVQVKFEKEGEVFVVTDEEAQRIHLDKGDMTDVTPFFEKDLIITHYRSGQVIKTNINELPSTTKPFLRHPVQLANFAFGSSDVAIFSENKVVQIFDIYENKIKRKFPLDFLRTADKKSPFITSLRNLGQNNLINGRSFASQFPAFNDFGKRQPQIHPFYDYLKSPLYLPGAISISDNLISFYKKKIEDNTGWVSLLPLDTRGSPLSDSTESIGFPLPPNLMVRMQFYSHHNKLHMLIVGDPEDSEIVKGSTLWIYQLMKPQNNVRGSAECVKKLQFTPNPIINQIRFVSGYFAFILDNSREFLLMDLNGVIQKRLNFNTNVTCFDIHETSKKIVIGCEGGELHICTLDAANNIQTRHDLDASQDTCPILQVQFSQDGRYVLALFENGYGMKVWELTQDGPKTIWKFPSHLDCKKARISNANVNQGCSPDKLKRLFMHHHAQLQMT